MRIPESLQSLAEEGIIEEVLRPLMSGKEAQVFLLRAGGEVRVAKVYKEAQERSFKQRAEYTEGRKVRNSRDQRAMEKRTRHGREQDEAAWRAAEVDMIYRLHAAGVRVPKPHQFIDGVLIMELVTDEEGNPAPRLGDVSLERESAVAVYEHLVREVVRMLSAGIVHGDLSDFNVLMGPDGPVIIDFPQAVNASSNQNARKLLLRDVDNLHRFVSRYVPEHQQRPYAEEMWQLYERGELTADTQLTGRYRAPQNRANVAEVSRMIADAERDERQRRNKLGLNMRGTRESTEPQPSQDRGPQRAPQQQPQSPRLERPPERQERQERQAPHPGPHAARGPRPPSPPAPRVQPGRQSNPYARDQSRAPAREHAGQNRAQPSQQAQPVQPQGRGQPQPNRWQSGRGPQPQRPQPPNPQVQQRHQPRAPMQPKQPNYAPPPPQRGPRPPNDRERERPRTWRTTDPDPKAPARSDDRQVKSDAQPAENSQLNTPKRR